MGAGDGEVEGLHGLCREHGGDVACKRAGGQVMEAEEEEKEEERREGSEEPGTITRRRPKAATGQSDLLCGAHHFGSISDLLPVRSLASLGHAEPPARVRPRRLPPGSPGRPPSEPIPVRCPCRCARRGRTRAQGPTRTDEGGLTGENRRHGPGSVAPQDVVYSASRADRVGPVTRLSHLSPVPPGAHRCAREWCRRVHDVFGRSASRRAPPTLNSTIFRSPSQSGSTAPQATICAGKNTADGSPANRFAPSRTSDNSCQACRASTPIGIPVGLIVRSTPPELVQPSHRRLRAFTPSVSARLVLSFLGRRARPFSHPKVFANRPHSSFQTPRSLSLGFAHPPATAATAILPWRTSTSRRLPNCTDPFKHLLSRPIRLQLPPATPQPPRHLSQRARVTPPISFAPDSTRPSHPSSPLPSQASPPPSDVAARMYRLSSLRRRTRLFVRTPQLRPASRPIARPRLSLTASAAGFVRAAVHPCTTAGPARRFLYLFLRFRARVRRFARASPVSCAHPGLEAVDPRRVHRSAPRRPSTATPRAQAPRDAPHSHSNTPRRFGRSIAPPSCAGEANGVCGLTAPPVGGARPDTGTVPRLATLSRKAVSDITITTLELRTRGPEDATPASSPPHLLSECPLRLALSSSESRPLHLHRPLVPQRSGAYTCDASLAPFLARAQN